jgi:protein-tyrosine phosphatase
MKTQVNVLDKILDNLFVGGIESSQKRWSDFKLIVNCTKDKPFPSRNMDLSSPECIRIPVNDTPDECEKMTQYMKETDVLHRMYEYICKDEPVLVHCNAGMQRSCALVACYLIKYYNVTPIVAMEHVKKYRTMAFFGGANFMTTIQNQYLV